MPLVIPYVDQSWSDGSGGGTPISAARLNVVEAGVKAAHYMPAVRVTHNANQSTTSGVDLYLAFNTEAFDTASNTADTMHDTVTNNSRLTCRYAGIYEIKIQVEFAANATGQRLVGVRVNGGTRIAAGNQDAVAGGGTTQMTASVLYSLAVNDYVETVVNQNSGGTLNVLTTSGVVGPAFSMVRVA